MRQSAIFIFAYTMIFGSDSNQLIVGMLLSQAKSCTSDNCESQPSSAKLVDPVAAQGPYEGHAEFFQLPPPSDAFEWQHEEFSQCSVTCGEGIESSEVTCREYKTGTRVLDSFCDQKDKKPQRVIRPCWQAKCQAVWVAGEWGDCSAICGGGVSKRLVYCAEEVDRGTFHRTLDRLCRAQKPETEKLCNTDACPQWHAGQWSKCSKSCGTGVQGRAIVCKRTETLDCIDDMKPISERLCHQTPCAIRSDSDGDGRKRRPSSSSSSSLRGRDPSDVADPVKTYNYRHQNRGRQTAAADGYRGRGGGLVIIDDPHPLPLSPPTDHIEESGEGELSLSVTTVTRFPRQSYSTIPRLADGTTLRSEAESSGDDETDQLEGGPRGPAVIQLTVLSPVQDELDEYSVHQLEPRKELNLAAARRSLVVNLIPGTDLHISCRNIVPSESSVWEKNGNGVAKGMLHLRNVRQEDIGDYICLRGNRTSKVTVRLRAPVEAQRDKAARASVTLNPQKLEKKLQDASKSDSGQPEVALLRNIIAPSSAMLDVIPLSYVVSSEWSKCQCGAPEAVQTRTVSCEFVTETFSVEVDSSYCARRKVKAVLARKDCSKTCYSWTVGDWKKCSGFPCVSPGVGTRWRLVECSRANGTRVAESRCHAVANRPTNSESCPYKSCQAAWKLMPWSECSVSCGYKGLKTREVRCVWTGYLSEQVTDESMCSRDDKPTTHKLCFNPPCANSYCRDESVFCSNVPLVGLCHLQMYAQKCCYSCTKRRVPAN